MKKKQHEPRYFPRGPEIIPKAGSWQHEEYMHGRRFYETILEGQRFPEGAGSKELDRLANVRAAELAREAAEKAMAEAVSLEQTAPVPSAAMPEIAERIAA